MLYDGINKIQKKGGIGISFSPSAKVDTLGAKTYNVTSSGSATPF